MALEMDEYTRAQLGFGLDVLKQTQQRMGEAIPGWSEGEAEYVRTTFLALMVETAELLQLFDWKQWKRPMDITGERRARVADEFADVLAFLGYVVLFCERHFGLSPQALADQYARKTRLNAERLAGRVAGYGVRTGRPGQPEDAPEEPPGTPQTRATRPGR